jgi:hypothetical protein
MLNREPMPEHIGKDPSSKDTHTSTVSLSFEDLVVDGSLTPVFIQMMPADADKPTVTPEEGLLTELQCEV